MDLVLSKEDRIRPYRSNPFYWEYRGKPILLLGGAANESLICLASSDGGERDELTDYLDGLCAAGGNYARCLLSGGGPQRAWPWAETRTGRYDLSKWDETFWQRFQRILHEAARRDVIVHLELWATCDFYLSDERGRGWAGHPINPLNNEWLDVDDCGLPIEVEHRSHEEINPFFESVPALRNLKEVRKVQEAYVSRLLDLSLPYGHVLYCIDDETNADPEWGAYWAEFILERARGENLSVEITESWDSWDPTGGRVRGARRQDPETHPFRDRSSPAVTLRAENLYSYVEISGNNHQCGSTHFETAEWVRKMLAMNGRPCPITSVNVCGAGKERTETHASGDDAIACFWRNIFAGLAAVRFERPPSGLGLSEKACLHLRAARLLVRTMDFFVAEPRMDLLENIGGTEAYCFGNPAHDFAVCFLDGGEVTLDCESMDSDVTVQWLDFRTTEWSSPVERYAGGLFRLVAPGPGIQLTLIQVIG